MEIKKLILRNYKIFQEAEFTFQTSRNVIYGRNGTGKSSLIEALSYICKALCQNKTGLPANFVHLPAHNFNRPDRPCSIGLELSDQGRDYSFFIHKNAEDYGRENNFSLTQEPRINNSVNPFHDGQIFSDGTYYKGNLAELKRLDFFYAAYIPGMAPPPLEPAPPQNADGGQIFRLAPAPRFALVRGIVSFDALKAFFEDLEGVELQKKSESGPDFQDPTLGKIRAALRKLGPAYGRIKIDRTLPGKPLMVEKYGRFFNLKTQLSDGEAMLISLLSSIAIFDLEHPGERFPLLIDELDNSLHPLWQTKIIEKIAEVAPHAQIMATSHSPFIWAELAKDEIIHLTADDEGLVKRGQVDYALGGSLDDIIGEFFGTGLFAERFKTHIEQIEGCMQRKDFGRAREKIDELRLKYGELPVLVKFRTLIQALGG